jgi:hypothetical protein
VGAFLADRGMPTAVEHLTREHIEAWVESILARWTPGTAYARVARRGRDRLGAVRLSPDA